MPQGVVHFEISCKDADKQQAFYGKVLGWSFEVHPEMNYRMVSPPEGQDAAHPSIGGGLFGHPEGQSYVTVYAEVDDIQAHLDKAAASGGEIVMPPTEIGEGMGSFGLIKDPEGNLFGLYKSA